MTSNLVLFNEKREEVEWHIQRGVSAQVEVFMSVYSIRAGNTTILQDIQLDQGGVYTIVIDKHGDVLVSIKVLSE